MNKIWIFSSLFIAMSGMSLMSCETVFEEEEMDFSRASHTCSSGDAECTKTPSSKKGGATDSITVVYPTLWVVLKVDSDKFWDGSTIVTITKVKLFNGETSMEFGVSDLNAELAEPSYQCSFNCLPKGVGIEKKKLLQEGILPLVLKVGSMPTFTYSIFYVVRTRDENLVKGWTEYVKYKEDSISIPFPISSDVECDLLLNINLRSIQFDSEVTNWG